MLAMVLGAMTAASPDAWVVLSRKTGVTTATAMEVAESVAKRLEVPTRLPVQDVTVCKAKKACLIELARKNQVEVLITVEVAKIVNVGALRVESISVEEDGASLGSADAEGEVGKLVDVVSPKLVPLLAKTKTALGLDRVAEPPAPTPVVTAPVPPPPPPLVQPQPNEPTLVTTSVEPRRVTFVRLLPAIAGVALVGAGVGLRFAAESEAQTLRQQATMRTLSDRELEAIASRGSLTQTFSAVAIGAGIAGIGASLAWILFGGEVTASLVPGTSGGSVVISGEFP